MAKHFYQEFNYSSEEEVGKSELGKPLNNFTIYIGEFDPTKTIAEQLKPMPFYVFPVRVGDKIVTDVTVTLENGDWKWVDIGGYLSKMVYKMAEENNLSPDDISILRFAGGTFLAAMQDGNELVYSPYTADANSGLTKQTTLSSEILKQFLDQRQDEILQRVKDNDKELIGGINSLNLPTGFNQESILNRLSNYVSQII